MARGMKGQTMVFERVLLFMIGVIIFVSCFAIFMNYQEYFMMMSMEDQLDSAGSHISSGILRLSEKGNDTEARITISVPPRAGGEVYTIRLTAEGLNLTTAKESRFFNLYGLGSSFRLGGERILSSVGEFMIYKKGNRIILL